MTFRTVGTALNVTTGTTASATHNITMPTGSGGGILVTYGLNGATALTITPPASPWQVLINAVNSSNDVLWIGWLPPGSTQSNTSLSTGAVTTRSSGYIYRITGEDSWTPAVVTTSGSGSSVNPDSPSLTPSWGSGDTTWMAVEVNRNGSGTAVSTWPTSYATQQLYDGATGAAAGVGLANAMRQNTVATEDPAAWTISVSRSWVANTIGIPQVAATQKPRLIMPPTLNQFY